MYTIKNPDAVANINNQIIELFDSKKPFSVIRMGNMEGYFLDCFDKDTAPVDEFYYWLSLTSGVFPRDDNYLKNVWAPINRSAMINSDLLGFVDISGHIAANESFNQKYCEGKPTFYGVDDILVLDPGYLSNLEIVDLPCPTPWTEKLKGKKVLVVSAFVESIKHQWENIDKVWGENKDKIAPFELVDVIRSPFHPEMDSRSFPGCTTWDESLHYIEEQISKYEYDVLLVSAAAMAPALADFAKRQGKVGITICGTLQLYFGIVGARWAGKNPAYVDWAKMYNENWRWPSETDLPDNKELFNRFEHAYWK